MCADTHTETHTLPLSFLTISFTHIFMRMHTRASHRSLKLSHTPSLQHTYMRAEPA